MTAGTRDPGSGMWQETSLHTSRIPSPMSQLYLITDRSQTNGKSLHDVVQQALSGGCRAVQLREKGLPDEELMQLAMDIRQLTLHYGAKLLISRSCDICLAVDADGVHLGAAGESISSARNKLGHSRLIGYSAHSIDEALRAEQAGADFITFSPVFHTPSKALFGPPVGLDALRDACDRLQRPVYALGGIKTENIAEVMACGAAGIAMISAIIAADDPASQTAMILKAMR